jgi:hypothetical protein
MTDTPKLQPGSVLFFLWSRNKWEPSTVEVAKIGRKWATLVGFADHRRLDLETLEVNAGGRWGSGWCFRSREEWEQTLDRERVEREADEAWRTLRAEMPYQRPSHIDAATIKSAAKMLGMPGGDAV